MRSPVDSDEQRRKNKEWMQRIEQRSGKSNYLNMWPIFIAPVIPLIGLVFKNQPRVRNALMAATGGGVLIYAHGHALSSSKDVTG